VVVVAQDAARAVGGEARGGVGRLVGDAGQEVAQVPVDEAVERLPAGDGANGSHQRHMITEGACRRQVHTALA
jgi:hypothetical protein